MGHGGLPGGTGATGVFPAAYVAPPLEEGPNGYSPPDPGRGRRRPPVDPAVKPRRIIDYPRWGRTGFTRWLPSWKLIGALMATGGFLMMAAIYAAYSATTLPKVDALAVAQATTIYYKDGKTPIAQLATQNRQNVTIDQVPRQVQDAVLAAEDHTFRTNSGVDPTSIGRAVWSNLRGNSLQGGSTISQQFVKNVYDQRDRSYQRKVKEIFLAVKINRELDKNKILEQYLNTIYLGAGAYGIQAATHAYFGENTDVSKLTVSQGAFLAGIINAPSAADDMDKPDEKARAERRWNVVLDAMVTEGWLDAKERASLKFPKITKSSSTVTVTGQNGFLQDMIVKEAADEHGLTEDKLMTGGYKITSTFDPKLIKAGVKAVKTMLPKERPKGLNIGLASVDPTTGAVRAIYGGPKYLGPENNNATIARAQAGSTFKAFGLIAALEDGVSLKTEYNSDSPVTIDGVKVKNSSDGESSGYKDLVFGTAHSLNTVYAQLNNDVGADKMTAAARAAGIPKSIKIDNNLTNVLGSADPHAIDMASAYGTFAAQGIRRAPYTIQKITKAGTGKVILDKAKPKGTRVFDEDSVADLTFALQQVVKSGTGVRAKSLGFPVAGKTGTSSGSRSAWFVGYTPQLSTSVMMYQLGKVKYQGKTVTANVEMDGFGEFNSVFGGGYPLMIWDAFMKAAMNGKDEADFPARVGVGEITNSAPTPSPEPTQEAEPTQDANPRPTVSPTPEDTETDEAPEPSPSPTLSVTISPTADPTNPGNGNNNDGGGGGGQ